jgi:polysaccharide export outer membrane protein
MHYLNFILMLLLCMSICSCRTQNIFVTAKTANDSIPQPFILPQHVQYRIQKDDKVSISLWDHDDLSVGSIYGIYNSNEVYGKWLLVDVRGEISIPKYGNLHIEGMTVVEAEDTLRGIYGTWVVNPIVEVKVLNKEVTVIGEVKSPGKFTLDEDNTTLIEMIARAGDFDFYADKKQVQVMRINGDRSEKTTLNLTDGNNFPLTNIRILPGDIIYPE